MTKRKMKKEIINIIGRINKKVAADIKRTAENSHITAAIIFLIISIPAYANYNDDFNRAVTQRNLIVKQYKNRFNAAEESSYTDIERYKQYISSIKQDTAKRYYPQAIHTAPQALIFASFGMPELLLKETINDGKKYHVPVVMRGLYKNSFQETAKKIFDFVKTKNTGGIEIDPVWFRRFNIKAVPCVVVQNSDTNQYDIIYGNIPLKRALEIIIAKGDAKDTAVRILENADE